MTETCMHDTGCIGVQLKEGFSFAMCLYSCLNPSAHHNGCVVIVQVVEHFIHDPGCHGGPSPPCIPAAGLGLGHPSSSSSHLFPFITQSKLLAGSQVTPHHCSSSYPGCCVCWLSSLLLLPASPQGPAEFVADQLL